MENDNLKKSITINIDEYVSEKIDILEEHLNSDDNLLISSPTDSGKTYAIIEYAKRNRNKRIAFLMPTQALVDNVKKQYEGRKGYTIKCGYGKEWVNKSKSNFICTTYDSYKFYDYDFDTIIVDEAHRLAGGGDFRNVPVSNLLDAKSKKVLITGTPEIIEHLPNFTRVSFTKKINYRRTATIIESVKKAKFNCQHIIEGHKSDSLLLLRVQNKELIDYLHSVYSSRKKIVVLYSADKQLSEAHQDPKTLESVKKGLIPEDVDILLCTSIMDAGVSLEVNRHVEAWAVSDYYMPNAIDMVQLFARVRTNSSYTMNLTIIGQFGNSEIDESKLPVMRSSQLAKKMAFRYSEYAELDFNNYTGLLSHYNIDHLIKKIDEGNITKVKYHRDIRPVTISQNMPNFQWEYKGVIAKLDLKGYGHWKEIITGDVIINSKSNRVVAGIYHDLQDAIDYDIYFGLFITPKQYRRNLFNSLVSAKTSYDSSEIFRTVLRELLKGLTLQEDGVFKMDLMNYKNLNTSEEQKSIRDIAKLLYNGDKWMRNRIRLERLKPCVYVSLYLEQYKSGNKTSHSL
tara:strand:+ start:1307 stop:3013 length:1707 start_codon:yes stop_codon:yes gene_type:complete